MIGPSCLAADLAAAGAPADLRLAAAAGEFDAWSFGDPHGLAGAPVPSYLRDAAAVHAYEVAADGAAMVRRLRGPARPRPALAPRAFRLDPPTALQRWVLAALRRVIDAGERVTHEAVVDAAGVTPQELHEILFGLEARGLVEVLPAPGYPPRIVLGPRAHLFPEREMTRTERSKRIEALLREGKSADEVITTAAAEPLFAGAEPTKAEVWRVRAVYCKDLPRVRKGTVPTGENHARVVELMRAKVKRREIANQLNLSHQRVSQIIANAKRLGDLPS